MARCWRRRATAKAPVPQKRQGSGTIGFLTVTVGGALGLGSFPRLVRPWDRNSSLASLPHNPGEKRHWWAWRRD
ncbi:hypothetical protein BO99DRAFT_407672 [Aspergillus violaceofuscus CBS 115571]|uniref:Uncharacterized protein n=1 Tax=Aspergillus violaceofuscus (strain CBS 115571) TaxID=1450538 RepID=A0A2V5GVV7_ASPV1|nr:hypothetical protein BO99DRAFT_407672 [Aspergillus violaceofuscus CBS 115571]